MVPPKSGCGWHTTATTAVPQRGSGPQNSFQPSRWTFKGKIAMKYFSHGFESQGFTICMQAEIYARRDTDA